MDRIHRFMEDCSGEMTGLQKILTAAVAMAPENGGDGESGKCAVLEEWLRRNGFSDIRRYEAPDPRVASKVRPSLVVTLPGKSDKKRVWIMSHLDVVPPGDLSLWNSDPWTVVEKDGILVGRGVEDNQQGLVSSVFAALYFVRNGIVPENTVKLLFAADEECGSEYGLCWLVKNTDLFRKEDLILIPDGGDPDGKQIEIAEKNLLWLRFHVSGKQTHGSRPDSGINACLAADDLALRIHALENEFDRRDPLFQPDRSTFQPTMRAKNVDCVNIIPGDDVFYMDCRILPCYTLDSVMERVDSVCRGVEADYGVKIQVDVPQKSESPATSAGSEVVKALAAAIKKAHGTDAVCVGVGGGTVGAELRRAGFDAAVWSTLDDMAHQPNEYCRISSMIADAETMVELFGTGSADES